MEPAPDGRGLSPQAIATLIDNLKATDLDARLASLRVVSVIAATLGPERTRDELIPYLADSIDDEDEAMAQLAEELSKLVDHVGGPKYTIKLLPALEELASSEEAVVREKAAAALNKIAKLLSPEQLYEVYIPLVDRLTSAHWFSLRTTACALYPTLYTAVTDENFKDNVIQAYEQLCRDGTPMVRRAAATNLKAMLKCCSAVVASERLKPLFLVFMKDGQDSVRLLGAGLLPELARSLPAGQHPTVVVENCRLAAHDESWRVRYMVADVLPELQKVLASDLSDQNLLPAFVQLLSDTEAEVRSCAASKVHAFCLGLGSTNRVANILQHILPCVQKIVEDESEHCRASLANVIMGLSAIVGKQSTIDYLLPLFLKLLRDEHSPVRLNVISKLEEVNQVIGLEHLSQALLPAIYELAENDEWRTRLAIIEYIPVVSKQLGKTFFNTHLLKLATSSWLKDPIYAVRRAAVDNLTSLTSAFGVGWAEADIFPALDAMAHDKHFVHRLTSLFAVKALTAACSPVLIREKLLPIVLPLHQDAIPNIRMNVAKTLTVVISTCQEADAVGERARQVLERLLNDTDPDVKFFAAEAMSCALRAA